MSKRPSLVLVEIIRGPEMGLFEEIVKNCVRGKETPLQDIEDIEETPPPTPPPEEKEEDNTEEEEDKCSITQ